MKFTPKKIIAEEELQVPAFDNTRPYDVNSIIELIENSFVLDKENLPKLQQLGDKYDILYTNPEAILDNICQNSFLPTWSGNDEMEANELESKLQKFAKDMEFTQDELNELCEEIKHTKNPKLDRINEFKSELSSDIASLETVLQDNLTTYPAQARLRKLIDDLKNFEYSGAANETWDYDKYDKNRNYYKLLGEID